MGYENLIVSYELTFMLASCKQSICKLVVFLLSLFSTAARALTTIQITFRLTGPEKTYNKIYNLIRKTFSLAL